MSVRDYRIEEDEYYRSNFSVLYKALNENNQLVLLKFFQNGNNKPDEKCTPTEKNIRNFFSKLFEREVNVLNKLVKMPGVITLEAYDLFGNWASKDKNKMCYISTFYLKNHKNCYNLIEEHEKIPDEHIKPIGTQLLEALIKIHEKDIIHFDITPGNVLLESIKNPDLKLCDFGITRRPSESIKFGQGYNLYYTPGTPGYMSLDRMLLDIPACFDQDLYSAATTLLYLMGFDTELGILPEDPLDVCDIIEEKHDKLKASLINDQELRQREIDPAKARVLRNALERKYDTAKEMLCAWEKT